MKFVDDDDDDDDMQSTVKVVQNYKNRLKFERVTDTLLCFMADGVHAVIMVSMLSDGSWLVVLQWHCSPNIAWSTVALTYYFPRRRLCLRHSMTA